MIFSSTALRSNLLARSRHFKPLTAFWRLQKTEARPLESHETCNDSGTSDLVRPFEEIPKPKADVKSFLDVYKQTEGFTKLYKVTDRRFVEHGPIFKEYGLNGVAMVHVIDPDDFEKVYRAERGKYPRRPPVDIWVEHRRRRNHFPGVFLS